MTRALIVLDTDFQRKRATEWIRSAKHGTRLEFKQPKRTDDQNAKMWVMLTEVASQARHHGIKLAPDDWKLLFLDALKREVRMVPNLDGNGIVSLGRSSSDLSKQEMSDLIELIHEFGARNGVRFNEPTEHNSTSAATPGDDVDGIGTAAPSTSPDAPEISSQETAEEGDNPGTAAPSSEPNEREMVNSAGNNTDFLKTEMIKKLLQMAGDVSLSVGERLENLTAIHPGWVERMPGHPTLVSAVFNTSRKVIKGELTADKARQYLETLP